MSSIFHDYGLRNNLFLSEFIVYGEISNISGYDLLSQIVMVPSISVILFSNQLKMMQQTQIQCNEWLNFDAGQHAMPIIKLHSLLNKLFQRWLQNFARTSEDDKILDIVLRILFEEEAIEKRIRTQ